MIIHYDSDKPVAERCTVQANPGAVPTICGCFDLKIETTVNGAAREELRVHRWGTAAQRRETHAKLKAETATAGAQS